MDKRKKMYITADEVSALLGVSKSFAYKIIRELNIELKKNGYHVVSGKIPVKFFEEKFYGFTVAM